MRDFSQFISEIGGFALTFVFCFAYVLMEGMLFFAKMTENINEKCFLSLAKSLRIAITVIGWGKNLSSWSCPVHEVEEQLLLKYWSKTGITLGVKDRVHMWTISHYSYYSFVANGKSATFADMLVLLLCMFGPRKDKTIRMKRTFFVTSKTEFFAIFDFFA